MKSASAPIILVFLIVLTACQSPRASPVENESPPGVPNEQMPMIESALPIPVTVEVPHTQATVTRPKAQPTQTPTSPVAPDIVSANWLNSQPLTSADLRGRVVLVEFWTFG